MPKAAVRLVRFVVLLTVLGACSKDDSEDSAPPERSSSKAGGGGAAGKAAGGGAGAGAAGAAGAQASGAGGGGGLAGGGQAGAEGWPGGASGQGGAGSAGTAGASAGTAGGAGAGSGAGSGGAAGAAGAGGAAGAATAGSGGSAGQAGAGASGKGGSAGAAGGCGEGTKLCNGACVSVDSPATGCGASGSCAPCKVANAQAGCSDGACVLGVCDSGFANCDGDAANGCETPTDGDPNNCGECGKTCSASNGTSACEQGKCTLAACSTGFSDCDNLASNGCEVNTQGDPANCGACGKACAVANGTPGCSNAGCTLVSCNAGFADCNQSAGDGCEVDTRGDVNNCGECGHVCKLAHAAATCSSGSCEIAGCESSLYKDCDGDPDNGCEWKGICP